MTKSKRKLFLVKIVYIIVYTTNSIKYSFALTDKGIEFIFTSFLYINLVIMFLFVLEVRLHLFSEIRVCRFPFFYDVTNSECSLQFELLIERPRFEPWPGHCAVASGKTVRSQKYLKKEDGRRRVGEVNLHWNNILSSYY